MLVPKEFTAPKEASKSKKASKTGSTEASKTASKTQPTWLSYEERVLSQEYKDENDSCECSVNWYISRVFLLLKIKWLV